MGKFFGFLEGPDRDTLRWNFVSNVLDGTFFAFAMSFVSLQTVLPVFVKNIGGSNVAIGLIPVVWTFGFNFPQILIARRVHGLVRKKQLFLRTALIQRVPWLLLGALTLWIDDLGKDVGLLLFFVLFSLAAVGGSINLPVWFDLVAKLTPVRVRGRLMALRSILGSVLGILGGAATVYILGKFSFPESYALLFFAAFCMMMLSYVLLRGLKEHDGTATQGVVDEWRFLPVVKRALKTQSNYRNFLVADALLISSTMANAFYTVHAIERFSLSDEYAGAFTIAIMVSMIVTSLLFGYLADYFGHKLNLLVSAITTVCACVFALIAPSIELYLLVFLCSAATVSLGTISRLALIAELCSEKERPTYVAITNMITSPCILLGIAAGWIADRFGYNTVFMLAGGFGTAALFWLKNKVVEPRKAEQIALAQ